MTDEKQGDDGSHLAHMTNTLNFWTGTSIPEKTSAKRRRPLPLLVVHSGKTTTGRSALPRMFSNVVYSGMSAGEAGVAPVDAMRVRSETGLKPRILERGVGMRVEGDEIAAEPVPVRRPGVLVTGAEPREFVGSVLAGSQTGNTNIGLNLW